MILSQGIVTTIAFDLSQVNQKHSFETAKSNTNQRHPLDTAKSIRATLDRSQPEQAINRSNTTKTSKHGRNLSAALGRASSRRSGCDTHRTCSRLKLWTWFLKPWKLAPLTCSTKQLPAKQRAKRFQDIRERFHAHGVPVPTTRSAGPHLLEEREHCAPKRLVWDPDRTFPENQRVSHPLTVERCARLKRGGSPGPFWLSRSPGLPDADPGRQRQSRSSAGLVAIFPESVSKSAGSACLIRASYYTSGVTFWRARSFPTKFSFELCVWSTPGQL